MNKNFEELRFYLDKSMALGTALGLLSWDTETIAPPEATEQTAKVVGILAREEYDTIINDKVKELVSKLKEDGEGLNEIERGIIKELSKEFERLEKIPADEYSRFYELTSLSAVKWAEAKNENDYSKFVPVLKEVISYVKKFAEYRKKEGQAIYDLILSDFEEDFNMEKLDVFFGKLKDALIPLIKEIKEKEKPDSSFIFQQFDIDKQKQFAHFIAEYVGYDFNRGILSESEHPFTGNLHNKDIRITSHYFEDNLESGIFSVIHEVGHGLYEMNIPDEMTQTKAGNTDIFIM